MNISNRSDFGVKVDFVDQEGNIVPVPDYDFRFDYYVYDGRRVSAGRINGQLVNCHIDGRQLICTFDAPNLGCGALRSRKTYHIPDNNYPDGIRDIVIESDTGHRIV